MKIFLRILQFYYKLKKRFSKPKTHYVWNRSSFYKDMWEEAARGLSAKFLDHGDSFWQICKGDNQTWINLHQVEFDNPVKLNIAGNKPLSYKLLLDIDLPIPEHFVFSINEISEIKNFINKYPGYFVIKPAKDTGSGIGVTTHLSNYLDCLKAAALASVYCSKIIIERLIPGECYRLLFLNGEMIYASRRTGLKIIGNGSSTIHQLFQDKFGNMKNFKIDKDFIATTSGQELEFDTILDQEKQVLVKSSNGFSDNHSEIRTEYNEDVTSEICTEIIQEAAAAASTIDSKFIGVDIITLDPYSSLRDSAGVINELNTTPGLHHHYKLNNDRNPAEVVLSTLLKITN